MPLDSTMSLLGNIGRTTTSPSANRKGMAIGKSAHRNRRHSFPRHFSMAVAVFLALFGAAPLIDGVLVSAFRTAPISIVHPRGSKASLKPCNRVPTLLFASEKLTEGWDDSPEAFRPVPTNESPPMQARFTTLSTPTPTPRIVRVERMVRLPVWPVWAGVIDFFVGWIFGPEAGSKLEQYVLGGRVCPMQLDGTSTSPFLLLVHHHHNFWKWDAIFRKVSAFVLPEGFPAHPHRGFTTLTYFLPDDNGKGGGGFVHRDSIGVKQTYGSKNSYEHQAQWLFTGRGMLHEEMFDFVQNDFEEKNPGYNPRYELYQLWVNVPGAYKLDPPRVQLLRGCDGDGHGDGDAMPSVASTKTFVSPENGEQLTTSTGVVVIAGNYKPYEDRNGENIEHFRSEAAPLHSDLSILHVTVEETAQTTIHTPTKTTSNREGPSSPGWTYDIPAGHDTLIVYVRKGSCAMETMVVSPETGAILSRSPPTNVPIHSTVFVEKDPAAFGPTRERLVVRPNELDDPLDLLVLSGKPLYQNGGDSSNSSVEPVAMQGSMVMNNNAQIQQAYADYEYGQMGVPWDHTLGDEEWTEHAEKTKPRM